MAVPAIVRFVRRHARQKAVHFRSVFIMADDYHAVDEVKAIVGEEWNVLPGLLRQPHTLRMLQRKAYAPNPHFFFY